MDFAKAEENEEFPLRTKPNGSQLDIKNTHFDCILKWLFFIDLHLNLPPFRSDGLERGASPATTTGGTAGTAGAAYATGSRGLTHG